MPSDRVVIDLSLWRVEGLVAYDGILFQVRFQQQGRLPHLGATDARMLWRWVGRGRARSSCFSASGGDGRRWAAEVATTGRWRSKCRARPRMCTGLGTLERARATTRMYRVGTLGRVSSRENARALGLGVQRVGHSLDAD